MQNLSVAKIVQGIHKGTFSAREVAKFYLDKAKALNPRLQAFISLNDQLLEQASKVKKEGKLAGVPLGIKDMFCTKGLKTTAASKMLSTFTPPYSATVVERLKQEGALVIGKCNHDEFAMGSLGNTSYYGQAKNPWNLLYTAGGSSGGSASAVAGGLCPAAFGTDTGGSVRQPAHFCNLVGLKPSYGRISRYGIIAYASSLDQAGVFAKNVEDACLLTDVVTGEDSKDSTTAPLKPTNFQKNLQTDIKSLRVAYFPFEEYERLGISLNKQVLEAQEASLRALKARGCKLKACSWPYLQHGLSCYYLISTSEASSNLSRYDGVRYGFRSKQASSSLEEFYMQNRGEGFGQEVKQRILTGTFCLASGYYQAYYKKASQIRRLIQDEFKQIFLNHDAILCPVATDHAKPIAEEEGVLKTYMNDVFTVFANLAGLPALSLPCSFSKDKLPIGIQLIGDTFCEQKILNIAKALEEDFQVCEEQADGF